MTLRGALLVTAPGTQQARIGTDVTIPCSFTVHAPPIDQRQVAIFWYFQGKELLSFQNGVTVPADPRMSYTGRAQEGAANLIISNVTIIDGGIYKCSVLYASERGETDIRLALQAPPRIIITDNLVLADKESVLRSSISGFYPKDTNIKWLRDGEILGNVIVEKPQRLPDGTYNVNSSVTVTPTEEDRGRTFSCRVQHESLAQPLQENFTLVYAALPSVQITSQTFKLNVEQDLVCSASGYYPESIAVKWFLNGALVESTETQRINSSAVESVYRILPTNENWGMEITCAVEHETLSSPRVERLLVTGPDLKAAYRTHTIIPAVFLACGLAAVIIVVLLIKHRRTRLPKVRSITRSRGGFFSLDVHHFYPEDITVSWAVIQPPSSSQPRPIDSTIVRHENQDGTFNATSTSESLRGVIREDEPYIVTAAVKHNKLKRPVQREWNSDDKENRDFLARPEVEMLQPQPMLINKKTQVRCTMSHFYPDQLTVNWLKREMGTQEMTPIGNAGRFRIVDSRSELQPDKTFTHNAILEITPSLEDEGSEVICRVEHPSLEEPIERTAGPLQVLVIPTAQQPIEFTINSSGDAVASFSLSSFYPEDIQISWACGPTQEKKPSVEEVRENPDGTFAASSQCTIPGRLFKDPQFTVRVSWNHISMENPEHREISVRDPAFPWHPKIKKISPIILQVHRETTVVCKISGYFPEDLKVSWIEKKGGKVSDCSYNKRYTKTPIQHERMADNLFTCSPSLSFTPTSDKEELEFICRVEHPSLEQPMERSTGHPRVNVAPLEKTEMTLTPYGSDRVMCSLSLMRFYPQDIQITWIYEDQEMLPSKKKIIQVDDERVFDAISECIVPWRYIHSSLRVTWSHDSLQEAGSRALTTAEFPWIPKIEDLDTSNLLLNKNSKLQCRISGYFPSDLSVSWYRRKGTGDFTVVTDNKYNMADITHQRQEDKTYSCTASLQITPTVADQGSEFICRVQHPSLEHPLERGTGPLQVMVSPQVIEPVRFSVSDTGEVQCALTLQRFYPRDISITWSSEGGISYPSSDSTPTKSEDGTCDVTSVCTLPRPLCFPVHVTWEHQSVAQPQRTVLTIADLPWRPHIEELQESDITLNKESKIHCNISGYCLPDDLAVSWWMKKSDNAVIPLTNCSKYKMLQITHQRQLDNTYSCVASLLFTPTVAEDQGAEFICRVQHPSLERPLERGTGPLQVMVSPQVIELVRFSISDTGEVQCALTLQRFYPRDISITWSSGEPQTQLQPENKPTLYEDGTCDVTSVCTLPRPLCFPVHVTWEHQSVAQPQCTVLTIADLPWRPHIEELQESDINLNKESKIHCNISGYCLPDDLAVSWCMKKSDNAVIPLTNGRKYKMLQITHQRQLDNTYSCVASLLFTPTVAEDQGSEFICRVQHPSLERPLERGTGPLQVMVSPQVIEPVTFSISDTGEVQCALTLQRFYPRDITIVWSSGEPQTQLQPENKTNESEDGTCDVTSVCTLPRILCFPVHVTWEHQSVTQPQRTVLTIADLPWKPHIEELQESDITLNKESKIHCNIYGYCLPDDLAVSWWMKKSDNAVIPLTNSRKYKMLQITHQRQEDNTYSCVASLLFTPTVAEDKGSEFICKVQHPSLERPLERSTGSIQVMVSPQVIEPVRFSISDTGEVQCALTLRRFYPRDISITWSSGEPQTQLQPENKPTESEDGTCDVTSVCTLPRPLCFPVHVTWEHQSVTQPQSTILTIADLPWRPHVEELDSSVFILNHESRIECKISGYISEELTVSWHRKQRGGREQELANGDQYKMPQINHQRQNDKTYSCTASLLITPTLADQGSEFMCRVQHPSLVGPIERRTGPLQVMVSPQVIEPVRFSISDTGEVQCALTLQRFYPRDISITWSSKGGQRYPSPDSKPTESEDGTYDVTSVCTLPHPLCLPVHVTWEHQSVTQPHRTVLTIADLPWRPHIEQLQLSSFILNREYRIECKISSYISEELTVSWHRKQGRGREQYLANGDKYRMPQITHQRQPDSTYSCTASLLITPTVTEDQGAEFICRVQHPSLERPLERSTGPLQVMVSPQVIEPVRFSISDTGAVQCALTLRRFYPRDISITWSSKGGQSYLKSGSTPTESKDGTCDVTSVCTLPRPPCFPVHVTWEHQAATQPQSIVLCTTDLPWRPHIEELQESDINLNKESKIHCNISGYCFPEDLTVSWWMKKRGAEIPLTNDSKYKTQQTPPRRQEDKTYSCTASLRFTPTQEEVQGSEVICRVRHPSLEKPIEKTTKPIKLKTSKQTEDGLQEKQTEDGLQERQTEDGLQERQTEDGLQERQTEDGLQERQTEDRLQERQTEDGLQERQTEDGLQERQTEDGLQERQTEDRLQERQTEDGLQERQTEDGLQERQTEDRLQERQTEDGLQERQTEDGLQERQTEDGLQERQTEDGLQERQTEDGLQERQTEDGLQERQTEDGLQERQTEDGLQERQTEDGLQERQTEDRLQERQTEDRRQTEDGLQERQTEDRLQERQTEDRLQERQTEDGLQERQTEDGLQERQTEDGLQERQTEDRLQERQTEDGLQERQTEDGLQERQTEDGLQERQTEDGLQERQTEDGLQERQTEDRLQERQTEDGLQERQTEDRLQERQTEDRLQETLESSKDQPEDTDTH
ncbi:uncharacterized protein [Hyperolius riggenbachi]|uniref:uncharacterized protein n=1 Tax=Hyperolius riggenbachi TaxID=752182 RepID=UPI0035A31DC8